MKPTIVIGSDHAGFKTKQAVIKALAKAEYTIVDLGCFSEESVDYPKYAKQVAEAVTSDKTTKGILVCGSGTGMMIAANKVKGARAALAYDAYSAKMARNDNDANILTLRGRKFPQKEAAKLALTFLKTPFGNAERAKRRIKQLSALDKK